MTDIFKWDIDIVMWWYWIEIVFNRILNWIDSNGDAHKHIPVAVQVVESYISSPQALRRTCVTHIMWKWFACDGSKGNILQCMHSHTLVRDMVGTGGISIAIRVCFWDIGSHKTMLKDSKRCLYLLLNDFRIPYISGDFRKSVQK